MKVITTHSSEETQMIGNRLVSILKVGDIVVLTGDLGSGKTELVRGFMRELNPSAVVRSPSFSLVNSYESAQFNVNHFDFYRLASSDDLFEIGFDEYISSNSVNFIEWGEMFPEVLPKDYLYFNFKEADEDKRVIETNIAITF